MAAKKMKKIEAQEFPESIDNRKRRISLANDSFTIAIGAPGPNWDFRAATMALCSATMRKTIPLHAGGSWDNFNTLWMIALNAAKSGSITHFAMLNADVVPLPWWADALLDECERLKADLVSVPVPIKDPRGLTSTAIGDTQDPWCPFKRLTLSEIFALPETFCIADTPWPDRYLCHNTGCWIADLRRPVFQQCDLEGRLLAYFDFQRQIVKDEKGDWRLRGESEDWYFSRMLHQLGAKTYVTRKIKLAHVGGGSFTNAEAWGNATDCDTEFKWGAKTEATA